MVAQPEVYGLKKTFGYMKREENIPTEEEIRIVLQQMGNSRNPRSLTAVPVAIIPVAKKQLRFIREKQKFLCVFHT